MSKDGNTWCNNNNPVTIIFETLATRICSISASHARVECLNQIEFWHHVTVIAFISDKTKSSGEIN